MNSEASGLIDIRALAAASRKEPSVRQQPESWDAESVDALLGIGTGAPVGTLASPMLGPAAPRRDRSVTIALSALIATVVLAVAAVAIVALQRGDGPAASEDTAGTGPITAALEPAPKQAEPALEPPEAAPVEAAPAPVAETPAVSVDGPRHHPRRHRPRHRNTHAMQRSEAQAPVAPPAPARPPSRDRTLEQLLDRAVGR